MQFQDDVVGGVTLVRPAIQSPDFVSGTSGWSINIDGTAEFSDLTIRSSDGSGSTVVIANGQMVIRNGSNDVVVEIDSTGYRLYDSFGTLVAEITLAGGATNDPGFITYNPSGRRYYSMLSRGFIEFGEDGASYDAQPFIEHASTVGNDPLILAAGSGYKGNAGAFAAAVWRLISPTNGSDRPRMEIDSDGGTPPADLIVTGDITTAGIPARGHQTGSTPITFVAQSSFSQAVVFATPFATAPIVTTNITSGAGATSRWGSRAINVTTTGFTIFVFKGDAADPAQNWTNIPVGWSATVATQ